MVLRGPFRAVSLDLWFTTLYHGAGTDDRWREDRIRTLAELFRSREGKRIDGSVIETAVDEVDSRLHAEGWPSGLTDPGTLVSAYAGNLDAHPVTSWEEAGRIYSSAGLAKHPPTVNPEVGEVVRALDARQVPVIAITNTARRGESWLEFLRSRGLVEFRRVIASCEVGRAKPDPEIFREASRWLGMEPREILHVGDRWELDVDGARAAGCGAVLYRGLWSVYPPGMYPETPAERQADPGILCIDRLDELLAEGLLERVPGRETPP
ncbi:MAG: HAD family hydrolase [Thermoplasmata archaeon]